MNASIAQTFSEQGTLLFEQNELPLTSEEWQTLETLVKEISYKHIVGGDAGDDHSVWVCRFYNDVKQPEALHEKSEIIRAIIMSKKMRAFYKQFIGTDKLCLRRCQANLLHEGDYIGLHKDQDSSPDYLATVVFHLGSEYTGGEFVTHDKIRGDQRFHPFGRMALVNNCTIPHEVVQVDAGERYTLACFMSDYFGPNRTVPRDFKIAK